MERVRENVMEDERRSACGEISIGETKFGIRVELLIREAQQIFFGPSAYLLLQYSSLSHVRTCGWIAINIGQPLHHMNPKSFAVENVNHLPLQGRKSETRKLLLIVRCGKRRQVVEHDADGSVSPFVKLLNAGSGEHEHFHADYSSSAKDHSMTIAYFCAHTLDGSASGNSGL